MGYKELYYKRNEQTNDSAHKLKFHLWRLVNRTVFRWSPNVLRPWRIFLLRQFGAKIGKNCNVDNTVRITRPWDIVMGNCCSIDENCHIIPPLQLGDYVSIGNSCNFVGGGHNVYSRGFEIELNPIVIDDGAFLGAGVNVGMGVHIGQIAVIGAFSTILKNVPANTVVVSKPQKLIECQRLPDEEYDIYRYHYSKEL